MQPFKQTLLVRLFIILSICLTTAVGFSPVQTRQRNKTKASLPQPVKTSTKQQPSASPAPADDQRQVETVKIDTNLVTVPVVATDTDGRRVPDLRQEEFSVAEDGDKQEIALFATTRLPVHVVLLLDTSASTKDKLEIIQAAAVAFVEKLEAADRVKVISFDSKVHDLGGFSNDHATLKTAIYKTTPGEGTKLYDAIELALSSLRRIEGRKAIVLFSDGVDWHSDQASDYSTLRWLEEEGVTVYPIRYDTRAQAERIARQGGEEDTTELPTIDVIRKSTGGTTEPTFPSDDDPRDGPPPGQPSKTGPLGLPTAAEILRRSRTRQPGDPAPPMPPDPHRKQKGETERRGRHGGDPISEMMDRLYVVADKYLNDLADNSGGTVLRVDDLSTLPDAFAKVAAELQTQYIIGYYPTNKTHDGEYRNINVSSSRPKVVIRARPGYRAPAGN
ncbi:MAG: VWA domain-containing protein [bacterium]